MRVSPRLIVVVTVVAAIGLGAYIWFVRIPVWSCAEQSEVRERAFAEYLAMSELILSPRATLRPPLGEDIDDIIDRVNAAIDEIHRDSRGWESALERYFSAMEKHRECQSEGKSIF
jgi:hypothetical protein